MSTLESIQDQKTIRALLLFTENFAVRLYVCTNLYSAKTAQEPQPFQVPIFYTKSKQYVFKQYIKQRDIIVASTTALPGRLYNLIIN